MSPRTEGSFNQGWGAASFIILLVITAFVIAFTVNRKTHRSPNDVLAPTSPTAQVH
jgi:hypothetical protein